MTYPMTNESAATSVFSRVVADLAFTMHILSWLAVNGTAAIVEFPGVLYRGGNAIVADLVGVDA